MKFLEKDTIEVAKKLLGCYLIHETPSGKTVGKIVETEAYVEGDEAAHSFNGKTKRNEVMFGKAGRGYVYFTYGMYHCFNVVTNVEGKGEAVLIRALEPLEGIELMKKRRGKDNEKELCSGPAKLVIAMGIEKKHDGCDLINGKLKLEEGERVREVVESKRIGISKGKELMYRFYVKGSKWISR